MDEMCSKFNTLNSKQEDISNQLIKSTGIVKDTVDLKLSEQHSQIMDEMCSKFNTLNSKQEDISNQLIKSTGIVKNHILTQDEINKSTINSLCDIKDIFNSKLTEQKVHIMNELYTYFNNFNREQDEKNKETLHSLNEMGELSEQKNKIMTELYEQINDIELNNKAQTLLFKTRLSDTDKKITYISTFNEERTDRLSKNISLNNTKLLELNDSMNKLYTHINCVELDVFNSLKIKINDLHKENEYFKNQLIIQNKIFQEKVNSLLNYCMFTFILYVFIYL
jgi:outer membrane murein-binding lipoprotein Lpp